MAISDRQRLIDYLYSQNEKLNKELTKLDPNEEILKKHLKLIIVNELLFMLNSETDIYKTLVNDNIKYADVIGKYMYWNPDSEFDEELTFILRDNFITKLNK